MKDSEIFKIVETAQKYNKPHDITGLLLFIEGAFIQLLEGEESVIKDLYRKISQDERHEQAKSLMQGPIKKRDFESWNMGLKIFTKQDIDDLKMINQNQDFNLLKDLTTKQDLAIELMRYFYKNGGVDFNLFWSSENNDIEIIE